MGRTVRFISFLRGQAEYCGLLPSDEKTAGASSARLLTVLVLLALVVRGVMALLLTSVCDDAHFYMSLAKALNAGDLQQVFSYLSLNIYPPLLAGLSRLGGDWMLVAKLWGVVISSLAVLPLYGFTRRVFDARIAAAAGFLYVLHPGLVELSVEPVRESTFWFLFLLGLYLSWRSVEERSWLLFALNGVVIALAIHTRTEGWLLVPALVYWAFVTGWENRPYRSGLALGTVLCLLMTPLLILTVNVTLLQGHSRWELGRMEHLSMGLVWLSSLSGSESEPPQRPAPVWDTPPINAAPTAVGPAAAAVPVADSAADAVAEKSPGRLMALLGYVLLYFRAVCSAIEPLYLLLTGVGLYCGRQHLLERRRIVLSLLVAAVMGAVCVYAGFTIVSLNRMQINDRYFFTAMLAWLPFTGIGLLASIEWLRQLKWFLPPHQQRGMLVAPVLLGVMMLTGTADAWSSTHGKREAEARLGAWLGEHYGPIETVVSNTAGVRAGYFVTGRLPESESSSHPLQELVVTRNPDLVIIGTRRMKQPHKDRLVRYVTESTEPPLQRATVPEEFSDFVVLQSARLVARQAAAKKTVLTAGNTSARSAH
ncbi:MAG: glycosyltransferase family 39 protein [Planctomycetaceae bacterium]|nr:glycosyltransferase family 39 protein [Planctomycetaceae bacterium]